MKRGVKVTFLIVVLIFTTVGYVFVDNYNKLNQLNDSYQALILEYNELNTSYRILTLNYTRLEKDYNSLSSQYAILFSNYSVLLEVFNKPLLYKEIPSVSELEEWLVIDETDQIQYTMPNFICGDFSAMLSLHAKAKHWDVGLVAVWGYNRDTGESFAHAFNAIICEDGLYYIEPQTDCTWWYTAHIPISSGQEWWLPDFGEIYVQQYSQILWY